MHVWRSATPDLLRWGKALAFMMLLCVSNLYAAVAIISSPHAQRQLERARDSARALDYKGIVIYLQGPESHTSRITHTADAGGGMMRVQPLEGEPREFVQRGSQLIWYLPRQRRVIHDQLTGTQSFPALSFSSVSELLAHYRIRELSQDRVAGRHADLLQLEPLDGLRYGYRLWFDSATGLLLRVQSISESGQVVAQTGFSQLAVWAPSGKRFRWHEPELRGWKTERVVTGKADVAGWSFRLPEGFSQVVALRRITGKLPGYAAESREVSQIVCSDGIAGISIFIEPWSEARSAQPVQRGPVNMLGKRVGRFWLTIVGETPMAALRVVADSLEFTAPPTK